MKVEIEKLPIDIYAGKRVVRAAINDDTNLYTLYFADGSFANVHKRDIDKEIEETMPEVEEAAEDEPELASEVMPEDMPEIEPEDIPEDPANITPEPISEISAQPMAQNSDGTDSVNPIV